MTALELTYDTVETIDYHTCGEPFRIVPAPPLPFDGDTVADRYQRALRDPQANFLRELLALEPRGHADMYGGFVVPPDDDGAHLGVLFWHGNGYGTGCGHGTMALSAWAVDSGLIKADPDGATNVVVDVPSGRVEARVQRRGGRTTHIDFLNVASFVIAADVPVATTLGTTVAQVAFGGAIYAHVEARSLGLSVRQSEVRRLIEAGREIKARLEALGVARHGGDAYLDGLTGVILYEGEGDAAAPGGDIRQRSVLVYGDGQVDRSPCGSGTSSRLAVLAATQQLGPAAKFVHTSIVGTVFVGSIIDRTTVRGVPAVLPMVRGTAHRVGRHVFDIDPLDKLLPGLRLE